MGLAVAVVAVAITVASGAAAPPAERLAWGLAAGLSGGVGILLLYGALGAGRMGLVAPISSVTSAAVPVGVAFVLEGAPGPLQVVGIALAVVAILLVSRPDVEAPATGALRQSALALCAGLGLGGFAVLIHAAGDIGIPWAIGASRVGSVGIILLATAIVRPRPAGGRGALGLALGAGIFDLLGNAFLVLALGTGRLDIAAVLSSLYPISTVVLARVLLGERFAHVHVVGIVVAAAAIACITAG